MRRGVRSSNHDRPLPTEEMHGSDRVPDLRDYERAWWVGKGKPSTRAKWRSSRSACCSALENRLTPPTLSERRCFTNHQYSARIGADGHSADVLTIPKQEESHAKGDYCEGPKGV